MTLEVDTSDVEQLRSAAEAIAAQLRRHGFPPSEEDLASALEAMWPEIEARRLLWFAASGWRAEQEFTLEALAGKMGVGLDSVRAYHRNLARALKARGIELNDVLPARKVGAVRFYHLPEAVHALATRLPLNPATP